MSDAPQSTPQTTFAVYVGPPLETIRSTVASQFQVKDAFLDPYGVPTIQVAAEPVRDKFRKVLDELAKHGLIAAIRGSGDTLTVKVFQKPQMKPPLKAINLVLFIATMGTVFLAGYLLWAGGGELQHRFVQIVDPTANPYSKAAIFAGGLLAIIGLHEFGHKAAARHHRLDATLPYFIPGFPPIGTFGALISLRGPPANRDQLFDLGLSGPVVGFIVTIVVAMVSVLFGIPLSASKVTELQQSGIPLSPIDASSWPGQPAILILVSSLTGFLRPVTGNEVLLDSQLLFAAQIGALLTFINLVPAWQLDGGHISRAVFGAEGHRIATMVGIIVLLLPFVGYWTFALLIMVMMGLSRRGFAGVEPLDDVSPVSNTRKVVYLLALAMLGLTFFPSPF